MWDNLLSCPLKAFLLYLRSVAIKRKALKSLLTLLCYYTYLRAWTLVWSMKFTLLRTTKVFTRIINCFSNFLLPFLSIIFFCLSNLGFLQVFFVYLHISVGQLDLRRDKIHSSFQKKTLKWFLIGQWTAETVFLHSLS